MGSQSAAHWVEHLTMKLIFSSSTCFFKYSCFLTLYLEQAVKFDCLRCKSSIWGSPEIWFSHSSEKSFFLLFLCLIFADQPGVVISGWDCVKLQYDVQWPLHILFQPAVLEK